MIKTIALVALMFSRSSVASQASELIETRERNLTGIYYDQDHSDKALVNLFKIKDRDLFVKQPTNNLDSIYKIADMAKEELNEALRAVSIKYSSDYINPPVKSRERADQKVQHTFNGDASMITDIIRDSIVVDSIEDIVSVFKELENNFEIVKIKNRFSNPTESGYRDLSTNIKLPKTGIIAEVQIHLREISNVKSGTEHDIYEIIQGIERNAKEEQRLLTKFEVSQIEKAREESKNLYKQAWKLYLNGQKINISEIVV